MIARVEFQDSGFAIVTFPYDKWVVDQLKLRIPATARSYDPPSKRWTVSPGWSSVVIDILIVAFADEIEIIRPGSWPTPATIAVDPTFAALHLLPTAPPEVVRVVYRELAKITHPDRGGDTAAMQKINGAFDVLKARGVA